MLVNTKEREMLVKNLHVEMNTLEDLLEVSAKRKQRVQSVGLYDDTIAALKADPTAKKSALKKLDPFLGGEEERIGVESLINSQKTRLKKILKHFPLYTEWLVEVPGVGERIASNLLFTWYYKCVPVCAECGGDLIVNHGESNSDGENYTCSVCKKEAKGAGNLKYRYAMRDFPMVSSWWSFLGMGCKPNKDGHYVKPKRQRGVQSNWSTKMRTICYHLSEQFVRQTDKTLYGRYLLEMKKKREHLLGVDTWTKGHIHNAARNEAAKLFLSHFYTVARTIDGKGVVKPYQFDILGHKDFILPPFWDRPINWIEGVQFRQAV